MSNGSALRLFHHYTVFSKYCCSIQSHMPNYPNDENNPRHRPRKKETPEKVLGKIRCSSYKNV